MDLSDYASVFAPDTLATLDDVFGSQPDIVDLAFSGSMYADMVRMMLKHSEMTCYTDCGSITGMRMRSSMGVVAYMPDFLRNPIMMHLSGVLPIETFTLLSSFLPIVASAGPALDHFLDTNGYGLARTAFRALGFDVWAFLTAGFSPDMDVMLFHGDLADEDRVSAEIVEAWGEFLHTV